MKIDILFCELAAFLLTTAFGFDSRPTKSLKFQDLSNIYKEEILPKISRYICVNMAKNEGYAGGIVLSDDDSQSEIKPKKVISELEMNDKEWQFFDTAKIFVQGGNGGDGCVAFRREKAMAMMGPSGATGGSGGSVFLECDEELNTLAYFRRKVHHRGLKGTTGQGKSRTGIKGEDCVVRVPPGTVVFDESGNFAGELKKHGEQLLVARGGRGGRGNEAFKTNRNTAPKLSEKGEVGAQRWVNLELKLVADVGFVGVPNAGKSTLLNAATNAKPKIADYPFTTVVPNLGVCDCLEPFEDGNTNAGKGLVLADIPGLLEGAHTGKGLGIAFLRHIQRCRCLVHVVSGSSVDPIGDFKAINQELQLFNPKLLEKPQVVILNKIDLTEVAERQEELLSELKAAAGHSRVLPISAATGKGVKDLMRRIRKFVSTLPEAEDLFVGKEAVSLEDRYEGESDFASAAFQIETDPAYPGQFRIKGGKIESIAAMTNWDYYEAVDRFKRIMDAMGITEALKTRGVKAGDLIMINQMDFEYTPDMFGIDWIGEGEDGVYV